MDAKQLLQHQFDHLAYQLEKVLEGVTEADFDTKPLPALMSIREQIGHLLQVYEATVTLAKGGTYDWSTFTAPDFTELDMYAAVSAARTEAINTVLETGNLVVGADFVVGHDSYHVGQLAQIRLALNPEWNPYSIYKMG